MSSVTPSTLRIRADTRYNTAVLELHEAVPKSTHTRLANASYSTLQQDTVNDRAKVLEHAIDPFLQ